MKTLTSLILCITFSVCAAPKPVSNSGSQIWTNNNGNNVTLTGDSGYPFVSPTVNIGYPLSIVPLEQFRVRNQNVNITLSGYWEFGNSGNSTEAIVGEVTTTGTNAPAANGVLGYADGNFTNQTAISGLADSQINTGTNIAGFFSTFEEGNSGVFVGIFAEVYESGWSVDPVIENGVLVLDARASGVPIVVGRINNGTTVFKVSNNGMTASSVGFLVHSNTLANIPILSKGDNFYWSSNGVAYVICSSPAGVLTTNKLGP